MSCCGAGGCKGQALQHLDLWVGIDLSGVVRPQTLIAAFFLADGIPDRAIVSKLFEDWLQAKEDWGQSTLVLNHSLTKSEKKKGRYVMKTFRDLCTQFGRPLAKSIRERKLELGEEWYEDHPEFPGNEVPWINPCQ